MCAPPHPKRQAVLATLEADVAVLKAVVAAPAAVAKAIPSVPMPGVVVGALTPVGKKVKALKESALATLDESLSAEWEGQMMAQNPPCPWER